MENYQGHVYYDYWEGDKEILTGKYYKKLGNAINAALKMHKTDKYGMIQVTFQGGMRDTDYRSYYKYDKSKPDLVFRHNDPVDASEIAEWWE